MASAASPPVTHRDVSRGPRTEGFTSSMASPPQAPAWLELSPPLAWWGWRGGPEWGLCSPLLQLWPWASALPSLSSSSEGPFPRSTEALSGGRCPGPPGLGWPAAVCRR